MNIDANVRVVRVFVSSPIDVAAERGRVQAIAATLNREYQGLVSFETVLWEEHFYKADRSFQPQIAESVACDIVVSIFWTRIAAARKAAAAMARKPWGSRPAPLVAEGEGLALPGACCVRGRARGGFLRPRSRYRRGAAAAQCGGGARHAVPADRGGERHGKILTRPRRSDPTADDAGGGGIG